MSGQPSQEKEPLAFEGGKERKGKGCIGLDFSGQRQCYHRRKWFTLSNELMIVTS
jgi:hypothetical protein